MPVEVAESVSIARSPEAVYDFIAQPLNYPHWVETAGSVEPAGEGRFKVVLKEGTAMEGEVAVHERPLRHAVRLWDARFSVELHFELAAESGGTRVNHRRVLDTKKGGFGLMTGLVRRGTQKSVRNEMAALKREIEK